MNELITLAQATTDTISQTEADTLSVSAWLTLIIMIAILSAGLAWSMYRAATAKPVPDEEQFSGDV